MNSKAGWRRLQIGSKTAGVMERIRAWEREQSNSKLGVFYRRTRHSKRTHTQQHDTNNTTAWKGMVQHSGRERRGGGSHGQLGSFFLFP